MAFLTQWLKSSNEQEAIFTSFLGDSVWFLWRTWQSFKKFLHILLIWLSAKSVEVQIRNDKGTSE